MKLRLLACVIGVLALAGCSDSPTAPSNRSYVQFRLDANSCGAIFGTSTLTFTFFVDGAQVGTGTLGINQTSQAFAIAAGSHAASASVTNSTIRWVNLNFSVAQGQTFTYVLLC